MICMPRPSDKRIVDETAEYIRQESKISWIGLAKGGVYAEAPEYARNAMIMETFAEDGVTHIFTLDADIVPPQDTILRLLAHDRDIVAGVYPLFVGGKKCWSFSVFRSADIDKKIRTLEDIEKYKVITSQPLNPYGKLPQKTFKANAISGSTVLIKKKVFDSLYPLWYKTLMAGDFPQPIMGHDFFFSNKAREAGFELWVDPTIQCKHYNTVELKSVFNAGV